MSEQPNTDNQQPLSEDKKKLKEEAEQLLKGSTEELTEDDKKNLFEAFKAIDADQNWTLSKEELQVFMNECNLDTSFTNLIMKIIHKPQTTELEGEEQITFKEFLEFIKLLKKVQKDSKVLFQMLFDAIDTDKNGTLDKGEIKTFVDLFSAGGQTVQDDEITAFLKDFGNDEVITLNQLLAILQ